MNIYNPTIVILIYVVIFIFPGYLILSFFDNSSLYYYYAFGNTIDFNINNFYLLILLCLLPIILYLFFPIKSTLVIFKNKEMNINNIKMYWMLLTSILFFINIYFYYDFDFSFPVLSVMDIVTGESYGFLRSESSSSLNIGIFNFGLYLFGFSSLLCALVLRSSSLIYFIISVSLCIILTMFNLAKSPLLDFLFLAIIGYLFLDQKNKINFSIMSVIIFCLAFFLFYIYNDKGLEFQIVLEAMISRIFFGEIGDLPSYFYYFNENHINFSSILPPYIQDLLGYNSLPAAKIIAHNTTTLNDLISAGYYNTLFIGESFAVMGNMGLIVGPIIVILNLFLLNLLIKKSPKNIFTVLFISFFLFRLTKGLFSGIGPFILSSNQILLVVFIFYLFLYNNKNINIHSV